MTEAQGNKLRANEVNLDLLSAHAAIKGMAVPESMKIITKEIILTKEEREKLAKIINND